MHDNTTSYRVIILSDPSLVDDTYRFLMYDSEIGLTDDLRIPLLEADDTPAALLHIAASQFGHAGEGTVIVDRLPLYVFDDGDDAAQLTAFVEAVKPYGWEPGAGAELGSGWITWQHPTRPIVHMGIRRMMDAPDPDAMIRPSDSPMQIAERLSRFAHLIGAPFRATAGVSGLAALRNVWDKPVWVKRPGTQGAWEDRPQPRWIWGSTARPRPDLSGTGDVHWTRRATEAEEAMPYVVAFDVRAMYLAAASGAMLGWEAPANTGAMMFDPDMAGFWRVHVGTGADAYAWARPERGVPVVNPNRINRDGTTWVTTPVLKYLSETGQPMPEILDSWLSVSSDVEKRPHAGRHMRAWAEKIRDAMPDAQTAGDEILRRHVKFTYVESVAMLGTPGGRVSRLDWAWTIRDEARIRLIRKIHKASLSSLSAMWPLKVKVDCVWYPTTDPQGMEYLAFLEPGRFKNGMLQPATMGQFKLDTNASGNMAQFLASERQKPARRSRA